nr:reverse transcriptase domain-containing protein [Tanacetum cinerariifolium]
MHTRSKFYPNNSNAIIPRRSNRRRVPNIVEPEIRTIEEIVPMADHTMEELLQAPTEGYGEAIVIPNTLAENFEIKTNCFKGAARIWYEKEPPNSILTWDDLVNKFVNQFFHPSKTTHLKNKISCFTQLFEETFGEAWERFKEMLRACPHHGFSELTQIDTFYIGLNEQDQDSLNAAAGGNLLSKTTRVVLKIIENKSKVRYSRSKSNVSRVNTNSRDNAIEKTYVICGGAHANYDCIATDSNQPSVCAANGTYNQVSSPNRASHQIPPPSFAPVQNNPNRFNQNQGQGNNFNRENNFQNNQGYCAPNFQNRGFQNQPFSVPNNQIQPGSFFQNQASTSGTLPSNIVPNPKGEMKAVTTRSGLAYEGPHIHANSPLKKVVEQNTEETTEKEHSNCQGSTAQVQPPVVPISIPKPDVPKTQPKPTIPYPSRLNDQKLCEKATNQMEKFFQIFYDMHFDISFADALLLMQNLLQQSRACLRIKINYLNVIDIACEEFVQNVLDFHYNPKSSNSTLVSNPLISKSDSCKVPIVKSSSPTLTPFGESDFFLKEIEDFFNDESILAGIDHSFYDPKGNILFLEKLLNEDPFQLLPLDLKQAEETKAESSIEEPPELELKELPSHLEYAFLEESNKLPVIIAKDLKDVEKEAFIKVLKSHKRAIVWKISDIKGIDPRFCTHKILMEEDYKPAVQGQRRPVVSPIHCVPKKGGMIVVANEKNKLIPTRLVTGWRVCIDYRKLNDATWKDHFSLPFMHQILERLAGNEFYCFLDGFSGYFQIPIDPQYQEKTTFTCPYGTFAYRRMPFGLCNAPGTFQRCMIAIFHDMIEMTMKVFMDEFSVFGDSFSSCLTNLDKMLKRCEETNLVLNWEKCHFMSKEGIVLGHKILKSRIEVDRAKVDVSNRGLKRILDRTVGEHRASWSDKLDDAFWAFRTAFKTPISCTPYKLIYGKSCHLPIELEHKAYWALKHVNFDLKTVGDHRKLLLNELNELRDQAYENSVIYKKRTKKLHDSKIKNRIFNVGDQVLLFKSRLKIFSEKIKTRWSGPFTITQVFPYGTVELSQPNGLILK